ncbi:hypothetical protein BC830DRAFT_1162899 [Chytriomyces sp. MP71]|nr:hypothetical protein BC830DRAFT_1162899 [Chytriomyces sp. MP71]
MLGTDTIASSAATSVTKGKVDELPHKEDLAAAFAPNSKQVAQHQYSVETGLHSNELVKQRRRGSMLVCGGVGGDHRDRTMELYRTHRNRFSSGSAAMNA